MTIAVGAAALFLAAAQPAAAQPGTAQPSPAGAGDRDAECFLLAAVGSQRLMSDTSLPAEARRREPLLRATAAYFGGRLSTRLSGATLQQALAAAGSAARRPNLGALIDGCTGEFQSFMRAVASTPDAPR